MHNRLAELQAYALLDLSNRLGLLSSIWMTDYDPLRITAVEIASDEEGILRDRNEIRRTIDELSFSSQKEISDRSSLTYSAFGSI